MIESIVPHEEIAIPSGRVILSGILSLPSVPRGTIVFSHGSGSGRFSPRNRFVADQLFKANIATLLLDLLTPDEEQVYETRFDIQLLTLRLADAVEFTSRKIETKGLPIGLFGASTGAASALNVAAAQPKLVKAVVSRGGRPDLATPQALARVRAPTLLIVGARDHEVLALNREALAAMHCEKELAVVPGATHLFEEPGTLEQVAELSVRWFGTHFKSDRSG